MPRGVRVGDDALSNVVRLFVLWVVMNMIYSDSAKTIADIMGGDLESVDSNELVKAIHALALDKLTDEDGMFNVRHYFGLQ